MSWVARRRTYGAAGGPSGPVLSLVFIDYIPASPAVAAVKPDGTDARDLAVNPAITGSGDTSFGYILAVTPDNAHVVFSTTPSGALWIAGIDGTGVRQITNIGPSAPYILAAGTLSPAGDKLLVPVNGTDLVLVNLDNSGSVTLAGVAGSGKNGWGAYISPAGTKILTSASGVSTCNLDGTGLVTIVSPAGGMVPYPCGWFNDGTVFVAEYDSGSGLVTYARYHADGSNRTVVYPDPVPFDFGQGAYPVLSPDDSQIAFEDTNSNLSVLTIASSTVDIACPASSAPISYAGSPFCWATV